MYKRIFLLLLILSTAISSKASRKCFDLPQKCNPDLLCSFKSEWYAATALWVTYSVNNPSKKGQRHSNDGLYYDGALYDESVKAAKSQLPNGNPAELAELAGQIFEEKAPKLAQFIYEPPSCEYGGKLDENFIPMSLYKGMSTDTNCDIWVNYGGQQYPVQEFSKQPSSTCEEYLQEHFIHEQIHKKVCEDEKKKKLVIRPSLQIQNLIPEEISAYALDRQILEAEYRLLSIRCSTQLKNPNEERVRMDKLTKLLSGYENRLK